MIGIGRAKTLINRHLGPLLFVVAVSVFVGTVPASAQTGWHYAWVNGKCYRTAASAAPPAPTPPYWHRINKGCSNIPLPVTVSNKRQKTRSGAAQPSMNDQGVANPFNASRGRGGISENNSPMPVNRSFRR